LVSYAPVFYKGNIIIADCKSPGSLYDARITTMERRASVYGPQRRDCVHPVQSPAGAETLQKNNVRKLGNRRRTSIASPRQSVNKMEEIL
jgi:hypothetical protein